MTTTAQADFITSLRNTDLLTARDAYQWSTAEIAAAMVSPTEIREYRTANPDAGRKEAREALTPRSRGRRHRSS